MKPNVQRTEFWIGNAAVTGILAVGATKGMLIPSIIATVVTVVAYAYYQTPLASPGGRPGIKTKAFWSSLAVIVVSTAAALLDFSASLPPWLVQTLSVIVSALTAIGYTAVRSSAKTAAAKAK